MALWNLGLIRLTYPPPQILWEWCVKGGWNDFVHIKVREMIRQHQGLQSWQGLWGHLFISWTVFGYWFTVLVFPSGSSVFISQLIQNQSLSFPPIKRRKQGLPWWRSGWESACQCRGHGFEPWSGKIPHAVEQLGPWATITELARLEPVLRNKRGRDSERPAHRDEEWPPLAATGESPHTETKTQHSHK